MNLAPQGWREKYLDNPGDSTQIFASRPECPVAGKVQKSTWARLIKKVYGTCPLVCAQCGAETKKILKAFWSRSVGPLPILTRLL